MLVRNLEAGFSEASELTMFIDDTCFIVSVCGVADVRVVLSGLSGLLES